MSRRGGRHVKGVAGDAVSGDLGVDPCPALQSVVILFQDQQAASLGKNKPVPFQVEGTAGFFRLVVAGGKSPHGVESTDGQGTHRGFRAAGHHDIGVIPGDHTEGVADGVCP